jgi:hypothetical protein
MVTFQTTEEKLYHHDIGYYTAYGISALRVDNDQAEFITHVSDVFLEKEKAESFVRLCNELHLDLIHFFDVIEDAIS